jgi:hypothetical protein
VDEELVLVDVEVDEEPEVTELMRLLTRSSVDTSATVLMVGCPVDEAGELPSSSCRAALIATDRQMTL